MNFSSTSIVPHCHGLLKGISTRSSLPWVLLCVLIPALIRSHLRRAMHRVTDGNKAFSYSQTPLIAFLREEKSKIFSIYINRYGFSSYFCSHLIPPTHTGMISAAVEAVTAESAEANTHSGRRSACNCLPPRTTIVPGLLSAEPQASGEQLLPRALQTTQVPKPNLLLRCQRSAYAQPFLPK